MRTRRDEPPLVLERVRAEVHAAGRRPPGARPTEQAPAAAPGFRAAAGAHLVLSLRDLVAVIAVIAVELLSGDLVVSLLAGVAALGAVFLHRIAISGRFGFGDGFVAFRPDTGWPHGVQEDDDFHWSWTRPDDARPAPARRSAAR